MQINRHKKDTVEVRRVRTVTGEYIDFVPPDERQIKKDCLRLYGHLSVRPGYMSLYNSHSGTESENQTSTLADIYNYDTKETTTQMPDFNKPGGIYSDKAKKRINRAIDWLMEISPLLPYFDPIAKRKRWMRINFITLTLPASQIHDDLTIKKECMNQFLTEMRTQHKMKNYIWGAESQTNGNIHFHITTNTYLHWAVIRKVWNRCLNKLGYIEAYRAEQKEWHKNGFKPRPELFKTWSMEKQGRAYKNGMKGNWSDPNSTDVHAVRKVENIAAYLSKHYSKQQKRPIYTMLKQTGHNLQATYNPSEANENPAGIKESYRAVDGNLWGLSQTLSKLCATVLEITTEILQELDIIVGSFTQKIHSYDWNMNIYVPVWKWSKLIDGIIAKEFKNYKFSMIKG